MEFEGRDRSIEGLAGPLRAVTDPTWRIEVEGFDPLREADVESWFTVGNGRLGLRGSVEAGATDSSPALFVAGIFGRAGRELWTLEPLPGPDVTSLTFRRDDKVLDVSQGELVEATRALDLQRGILFRTWRRRWADEEMIFTSARFASLADRAIVVVQAKVQMTGDRVALEGEVLVPPQEGPVEAAETSRDGEDVQGEIRGRAGGAIAFAVSTEQGDETFNRIAKIVPIAAGEGRAGEAALDLGGARSLGVDGLRARHEAAWLERWSDSDVVIEGDPASQRGLRFALYHLISAGNPDTDRTSIGARGLTGMGYKGHVFWDTDVFMVPFFIYTHPETARALLAYRYRTLPAARARAQSFGCRGALFAWESADTGEDCTPPEIAGPDGTMIPVFTGEQEVHIAADVAWAVWEYWCATGDEGFLLEMGAEIVLETARFWASRVRERDGGFHIDKVVGADEYHEDVNDNAFTNGMARWNLERALDLVELLRGRYPSKWERLSEQIHIRVDETSTWESVARGLVDQFHPESLLFEEFSGFFALKEVPVAGVAPRPFSGEEVFGWQELRGAQIVKQADVVMMLHLLRDSYPPDVAAANFRYYEPRTTHGSSLSPAMHAAVAARAGLLDDALTYFRMAAQTDLGGRPGFSAKGVHMATAGGLWQAAVMGFGGLTRDRDHMRLDPRLPRGWKRLRFPIGSQGVKVVVDMSTDGLALTVDGAMKIALGEGPVSSLAAGRYTATRSEQGWSKLERDQA